MTTTQTQQPTHYVLLGNTTVPVIATSTGQGTVRIDRPLGLPKVGTTGFYSNAHGEGRVCAHSGPRSYIIRYADGHEVTRRL